MNNDFHKDEWGNIELPGLSDETLHTKNWNRARTKAEKAHFSKIAKEGYAAEGTEWRKQITLRNQNKSKEWIDKISATIKEKQNQPEYLEHMSKQRLEAMDQVIPGENMTLREKITLANQESAKDPVAYANRVKANRETCKKQYWKDAHAEGVKNYSNEVITPDGIFDSLKAWGKKINYKQPYSLLKRYPHLIWLTTTGPGEPTYHRFYKTPYGEFESMGDAFEAVKNSDHPMGKYKRGETYWWNNCIKKYPNDFGYVFHVATFKLNAQTYTKQQILEED